MRKKAKKMAPAATALRKAPVYHHYTAEYLLSPQHPVTVHLIGCGGTGSQMLTQLARVHTALRALGHPGLHVQAWDDDNVTDANLGRQMFSPMDIGHNKAVVLITRINRFFGLKWLARPERYGPVKDKHGNQNHPAGANIIITAVDNIPTRKNIGTRFSSHGPNSNEYRPDCKYYYWLDLGNTRTTGQVVLGTWGNIKQPKKTRNTVPKLETITELFPNLEEHAAAVEQGPSCSLAEALERQDLFVNSILAQYGGNLLWKLFRELRIRHHGIFVNLETLNTNPIMVEPA